MSIIDALIPAILAGIISIILGAIVRLWYPPYGWDTILSMAAGVTVGNFIMHLIFNGFKF